MSFLTELSEYTAKSAVVIKDLVLKGDYETATLLMSLQSTANDDTLTTDVRLNALTALINRGGLLDIALPPYYPVEYTFPKTQTYVGLHNDLSGLNTGDFYHLTYDQYVGFLNKPSIADINFSNLQTGSPYDSVPLGIALNAKEDLISSGTSGQFYAWDKTMRFVDWSDLASKPITLLGFGISAADTLFDGKYLAQSSVISSYVIGASIAITNADTLVGALGKLQAQINTVSSATGTINTVGLIMPGIFSVGNSPLTGTGGTINVTLASQSAKTFLAAPNAGSGTPTFRQILAADLPTSGVTAGTYGNTTNWPTFTVDAYGRITSVNTQLATSGGTVTSVALSAPVEFSISGSPVISNGTLGFSWTNQTANYVMAGPVSGVAASPSFRALVAADIPTIEMSQVNGLEGYLDSYLPDALANSTMFIGNGSDAAVNANATGDLTLLYVDNLGANEAQFTIANQAVTYAKMQNVSGQKLLGRYAIAAGSPQEITFDPTAFTLNSSTGVLGLFTPNPPTLNQKGDLLTSTGPAQVRLGIGANATFFMADSAATTGNKWVAMGGDATLATSGDLTISAAAVTLSKMADADAYSIIGNNTASPDTPIYLTKTQATTLINSFDPFLDLPGLVPNGSGFDATYYLDGTGNWSVPSAGGTPGGSTGQFQYNDGTTFAGSPSITTNISDDVLVTSGKFGIVDNATSPNYGVYITTPNVAVAGLTWSIPTFIDNDIFVGEAFTQILTNKTLSTGTAINVGTPVVGTIWYSSDTAGTVADLSSTGNGGKYLKLNASTLLPEWSGITASSATNIDGGVAYQIPYQTAPSTTSFITAPTTASTFLQWNGSAFTWATAGSGSGTVASGAVNNLAYYSVSPTGTTVSALGSLGTSTQVLHGNASGVPTWGAVALASDVSGTLPVANGGTGQTTYTDGQLLIGNTTGNTLTKATLTAGSGITITNGAGSITIASSASAPTLNQLQAATAANTPINNANFAQEWQWNTISSGNGFYLSSTSTAAASDTQTLFRVALSGANATTTQSTFAGVLSNTHTGTNSTNYALQLTASGGTTNYALNVTAGIVRMAAGTASVPQLILTPTTATPSGNTAGSMWYYESGGTEYLALYKTTAATQTKIITKDRNPDFVTSSNSGIIVSDANGTLTKSADLTALGIFSGTADGSTLAAAGNADLLPTSVVGSKTLPANFFAVGKTIEVVVSGKITTTGSPGNLVLKLQFGATPTDIATITLPLHSNITNGYWDARFVVVCRTTGATGGISANGVARMETNTNANMVYGDVIVPTTLPTINTANAQDIKVNGAITASNSVTIQNCYANYLN